MHVTQLENNIYMMCILMNDYPVKRIDEFIDDVLDAAAG